MTEIQIFSLAKTPVKQLIQIYYDYNAENHYLDTIISIIPVPCTFSVDHWKDNLIYQTTCDVYNMEGDKPEKLRISGEI